MCLLATIKTPKRIAALVSRRLPNLPHILTHYDAASCSNPAVPPLVWPALDLSDTERVYLAPLPHFFVSINSGIFFTRKEMNKIVVEHAQQLLQRLHQQCITGNVVLIY